MLSLNKSVTCALDNSKYIHWYSLIFTDSLAVNTQNAPEFICPICLHKPKALDFNEKRLHWASVVRAEGHQDWFLRLFSWGTYWVTKMHRWGFFDASSFNLAYMHKTCKSRSLYICISITVKELCAPRSTKRFHFVGFTSTLPQKFLKNFERRKPDVFKMYHKVASSRPAYYSILNSFSQRSQYISIKFPLHKLSVNP